MQGAKDPPSPPLERTEHKGSKTERASKGQNQQFCPGPRLNGKKFRAPELLRLGP